MTLVFVKLVLFLCFRKILEEQIPKVLSELMPVLWLIPKYAFNIELGDRFLCPVYQTPNRLMNISTQRSIRNLIFAAMLGSNKNILHWAEQGVAIICQPNEQKLQ